MGIWRWGLTETSVGLGGSSSAQGVTFELLATMTRMMIETDSGIPGVKKPPRKNC